VRTWIYRAIDLVGPWAMLDVFVLAILVALVKLGELAIVLPGPGLFALAAVVVLTILASGSFDPTAGCAPADRDAAKAAWGFPLVWIVPLIAAIVAGTLVYNHLQEFGPTEPGSRARGGDRPAAPYRRRARQGGSAVLDRPPRGGLRHRARPELRPSSRLRSLVAGGIAFAG